MFTCFSSHAQVDSHLRKLAEGLFEIRKEKSSDKVLKKMATAWSSSQNPKIALMDDIKCDSQNEYQGKTVNRFKVNKLVARVYSSQNTGVYSKGEYFNSTERDIYYSAIEKTIKKKKTVTYRLTGHIGKQEFFVVPYHADTKFVITVNGKLATVGPDGEQYFVLPNVSKNDIMVFSITNQSNIDESFVILNHNPQK